MALGGGVDVALFHDQFLLGVISNQLFDDAVRKPRTE